MAEDEQLSQTSDFWKLIDEGKEAASDNIGKTAQLLAATITP